jgi:shikimate kinase
MSLHIREEGKIKGYQFDSLWRGCYNSAMKCNIVLIGFMASGKSTLGRVLQKELGWPLISTDEYIEEKEGRKIVQIFKDFGESHFRTLEHKAIQELTKSTKPVIIDCGGGIVLNPENIKLLKKTGTLFYLSCTVDVIDERIHLQPTRPLLDVPDPKAKIEALLKERLSLYEQADFTIDTSDGDMTRAAQEVLQKVAHD